MNIKTIQCKSYAKYLVQQQLLSHILALNAQLYTTDRCIIYIHAHIHSLT